MNMHAYAFESNYSRIEIVEIAKQKGLEIRSFESNYSRIEIRRERQIK